MKVPRKNQIIILFIALFICCVPAVSAFGRGAWNAWDLLLIPLWLVLAYFTYRIYFASDKDFIRCFEPQLNSRRLADVYLDTTRALACAIAAKDAHEQYHVSRVQAICELVAAHMGLGRNDADTVAISALVHDVGKLGVPEYILLKPGPLDADEFDKMKNHAVIGAKILENVDYPWDISGIVRHHHEKFDGTGYPDHLSGERIPLASRIIAVAEVYDALVSDRCYKDGWPHHQAVEHIVKLSGTHFDPKVVRAFVTAESEIAQVNLIYPTATEAMRARGKSCAAADAITQANQELISLFDIAQTLSSTLEIDEVLALLAHRTRRLLQAAACAVFTLDDDRPLDIVVRAAAGRYKEVLKDASVKLGRGVTGKSALNMTPYLGNYDPNDLVFPVDPRLVIDFKSCISVPIVNFGKVLGAINVYDVATHAFTREDLHTLNLVAARAALAIQNASEFEKVRDSAMRDQLTGLYNGRFLRSQLEQELSRAVRRAEPLSLLCVDLDHFKEVNDTRGHQMGDKVLKDVSDIFRSQVRDYDIVVRNGGDEFVIVLPGTPASVAEAIAARIRQDVDDYALKTFGACAKPLGASIGLSTFPDDASDLETLLTRADAAMYGDKHARKQDHLAA